MRVWIIFLVLQLMTIRSSLYGQGAKPPVFVFTDINLVGGDPDDRQSLIHLLWYADVLDIRGVVPDRWEGQGYEACLLGLEKYNLDHQKYDFEKKGFPHPDEVRSLIAKDELDAKQKFTAALTSHSRPLYVLVWGNMSTLANILREDPDVVDQIRILSIGTGRKYGPKDEVPGEDCNVANWNGRGRKEIYDDAHLHHVWWLENNWTYNGMFMGEGPKLMFQRLSTFGAMGMHIKEVTQDHMWAQYFRVGDTPTVLYLIDPNHDIDDPTQSSWAGKFKKPFPKSRQNYYTDDNGKIDWNYSEPCKTWHNLTKMYAYNKNTLYERRQEMYDELMKKLNYLYR